MIEDEIIEWVHDLPVSILGWLKNMESSRWGFYKFCRDAEAEYAFPASHIGLHISKILHKADDISKLTGYSKQQADANVALIRSCQQPDSGLIIDPNMDSLFENRNNPAALTAFRRAVTKYTMDLLNQYHAAPLYPYSESGSHGKPDAAEFLEYLKTADWSQPWGTGSHAAGKAREIFCAVNDGNEEYIPALREGMKIILSHQNPKTGMWGSTEIPLYQQISGALKIIGRLKFYMGMELPYMDKLADSCIEHHADGRFYEEDDMCFPRNVAEMCVACLVQSDYRREELLGTLLDIARFIKKFQQPDGAFSLRQNGRNLMRWCGSWICGDSPVKRGDILGTQGALWALGMIGRYLGWPEMPFPDPQGDWRERTEKLKYAIVVDSKCNVEIVKRS